MTAAAPTVPTVPQRRVVELADGLPYDLADGVTLRTAGLELHSQHPRAWLLCEGSDLFAWAGWIEVHQTVDVPFGTLTLTSMLRDDSDGAQGQDGDRARVAVTVDHDRLCDADLCAVEALFGPDAEFC